MIIPSGAVSNGAVDVQVGILLSGPFSFPPDVTPVSPIVWLCAANSSEAFKFSKPIQITLQHYVDCSTSGGKSLSFFKAAYDSTTDKDFVFKEVDSNHSKFAQVNGTLTTKSCASFVCIADKDPQNDMLEKSKYSLVYVIPKTLTNTFTMHFCLTFDLKTCIEVGCIPET